jgi:hypothetical protein
MKKDKMTWSLMGFNGSLVWHTSLIIHQQQGIAGSSHNSMMVVHGSHNTVEKVADRLTIK